MRRCNLKQGLTVFAVLPVFVFPPAASAAPWKELSKLEDRGAVISAFVYDLETGAPIAKKNEHARITPASTSKLVLGAAALEQWGPEHRFTTKVFATGKRKRGVLDGNLIIMGNGDPYLTNEILWGLTTDIARMGIVEVNGELQLNKSKFGDVEKDQNRQNAERYSANAYDSPLSAVAVNFSVLAAVAGPADEQGQNAYLALEPLPLENTLLTGQVKTSGLGKSKLSAVRSSKDGKEIIAVSGNVALGSAPERTYRSVSDADEYAGQVFKAFLRQAGVKIRGRTRTVESPLPKSAWLVTEANGFPLSWQLRGLQTMSNNFIADMLTLNLDAEQNRRRGTLNGGAKALEKHVQNACAATKLCDKSSDELRMLSGSGLTPENRLSATDLVAVLKAMYENTAAFPAFLYSLPMPGQDGTLSRRFSKSDQQHMHDRLFAKTGTLSQPWDAVGLAGYYRRKNGRWTTFAILVNGTSKNRSFGIDSIRKAIDSDLADLFPPES